MHRGRINKRREKDMGKKKKRIQIAKNILLTLIVMVAAFFLCAIGLLGWYKKPVYFTAYNPNQILEIVIRDGNTGKELHIVGKKEIRHVINNLKSIKLQRDNISLGWSGYNFYTTIYLEGGKEAGGWNDFMINSSNSIRRDPFFYTVTEGRIDYGYIQKLMARASAD